MCQVGLFRCSWGGGEMKPMRMAAVCLIGLFAGALLCLVACTSRVSRPQRCPPYTPIGSPDINPTWSPDGRFVGFVHGRRDTTDSSGIYVVDTVGSIPVKLSDQTAPFSMELAWSPDGS